MNQLAAAMVAQFTGTDEPEGLADSRAPEPEPKRESTPEERSAAAAVLGRIGGKKGGKARAEKLTPEERKEIAQKAAAARWRKTDGA